MKIMKSTPGNPVVKARQITAAEACLIMKLQDDETRGHCLYCWRRDGHPEPHLAPVTFNPKVTGPWWSWPLPFWLDFNTGVCQQPSRLAR